MVEAASRCTKYRIQDERNTLMWWRRHLDVPSIGIHDERNTLMWCRQHLDVPSIGIQDERKTLMWWRQHLDVRSIGIQDERNTLKGLAQAEIIKKSVILFWLFNMTVWCKHVHRLELQKVFNFCAAHSPARLDIETKSLISNYWQPCQK